MGTTTQNRDGLPAAIAEDRRFFQRFSNKKDATPKGWNDPDNWKTLDEIPAAAPFGYALTDSNILFIDFDHVLKEDGHSFVSQEVQTAFERIRGSGHTYTERSMSGTGIHMLCDLGEYADSFEPITNDSRSIVLFRPLDEYEALPKEQKDKEPKIEFFYKTRGRYVALTGDHSKLIEMATDETAAQIFHTCLQMIEECQCRSTRAAVDKDTSLIITLPDQVDRAEILDALQYISPDNYSTWVRIGAAIRNSGLDMSVWDNWSKGSDKYKAEEIPKKWDSFKGLNWNAGTIFKLAKENGYRKSSHNELKQGEPLPLPRCMDDIEEADPDWLVEGYIPLNAITIIAADGGVGKTTIETTLAAEISAGKRPFLLGFPSVAEREMETHGEGAKVLFFSGEDFAKYTIKKKMIAAGANLKNISIVDPSDETIQSYHLASPAMKNALKALQPKLVIIDPLQAFLDSKVNMIARNEMRQALLPLSKLADEFHCAFLIAAHSNKRDTAAGRNRISDSSEIWDNARSVLMAGETREKGIKYISHEKTNWDRQMPTILFKISDDGVAKYLRTTDKKDWDFQTEQRNERNGNKNNSPQKDEAKKMILSLFKEHFDRTTEGIKWGDVAEAVHAALGISPQTITNARIALKNEGIIYLQHVGRKGEKGEPPEPLWFLTPPPDIKNLVLPEND